MSQVNYIVDLSGTGEKQPYVPYGAVRDFWYSREHEVMLSGPYETGKTYGALQRLNALCLKYPGINVLMARKQYSSLLTSAMTTYFRKVLPYPPGHDLCPVFVFGGGRPEWVRYTNGSTIVTAGLDVPEKVLSAEYDFIYVPQAEELSLHDWEQLVSRATGRAGNSPYSQVMGDCNPGPPTSWILGRQSLKIFHTTHKDNPTLWDHEADNWTPQGQRTMKILQSMTGLRYKRGYLGLWAGAEGQVYEQFDESVHVIDPFPIPRHWRRYRTIDFGYTHPFTCQWWAEDEDGRLYMYREIYMTRRLITEHIDGKDGHPGIIALSAGEKYEATICDHDSGDRAMLERSGVGRTEKASKAIKQGIELAQNRLRVQPDGKPRVFFFRGVLVEEDEDLVLNYRPKCLVDEFAGYVWRQIDGQKEVTPRDEIPVRTDDHGLDCFRYIVMHLDEKSAYGKPGFSSYL